MGSLRRADITCMSPAELNIQDAIVSIEKMGADERLSKAQSLLAEAQNLVADYVDER